MFEVYPAINCHYKDTECVREKIAKVKTFAPARVHLDVADACLALNRSWNEPAQWVTLEDPPLMEVHLMVEEPERQMETWLKVGAKRIIVHLEAILDEEYRRPQREPKEIIREMQERCASYGATLMLAILPETSLEDAKEYLDMFGEFQVFTQAVLGPAGQKFLPVAIDRIRWVRARYPQAPIEVDGGINLETAKMCKNAGATIVVSGSYLLGSPVPGQAYAALRQL